MTDAIEQPAGSGPEPSPAGDGERLRRPTSLRRSADAAAAGEDALAAHTHGQLDAARAQTQAGAEPPAGSPRLAARVPLDRLPLDKLPLDGRHLAELRATIKRRPELGLGVAFAGGLILATLLKRLGRR